MLDRMEDRNESNRIYQVVLLGGCFFFFLSNDDFRIKRLVITQSKMIFFVQQEQDLSIKSLNVLDQIY